MSEGPVAWEPVFDVDPPIRSWMRPDLADMVRWLWDVLDHLEESAARKVPPGPALTAVLNCVQADRDLIVWAVAGLDSGTGAGNVRGIKILASGYRSLPGYRDEWRP